jgi:hypothetical protein
MALIPGTLQAGTKYPNDPQSLLDLFSAYLTAPEVKKNRPIVTVYTPPSASAVNFNTSKVDEIMYLKHDLAITGLSIVFPSDGNSVIGQTISIFPKTAVNATISYTNGTREPTAPTSFAAGVMYSWRKVESNTWVGSINTVAGWAAATGTASRTTFATSTVTTAQLAEKVKALIDDLTTLGILKS